MMPNFEKSYFYLRYLQGKNCDQYTYMVISSYKLKETRTFIKISTELATKLYFYSPVKVELWN